LENVLPGINYPSARSDPPDIYDELVGLAYSLFSISVHLRQANIEMKIELKRAENVG